MSAKPSNTAPSTGICGRKRAGGKLPPALLFFAMIRPATLMNRGVAGAGIEPATRGFSPSFSCSLKFRQVSQSSEGTARKTSCTLARRAIPSAHENKWRNKSVPKKCNLNASLPKLARPEDQSSFARRQVPSEGAESNPGTIRKPRPSGLARSHLGYWKRAFRTDPASGNLFVQIAHRGRAKAARVDGNFRREPCPMHRRWETCHRNC